MWSVRSFSVGVGPTDAPDPTSQSFSYRRSEGRKDARLSPRLGSFVAGESLRMRACLLRLLCGILESFCPVFVLSSFSRVCLFGFLVFFFFVFLFLFFIFSVLFFLFLFPFSPLLLFFVLFFLFVFLFSLLRLLPFLLSPYSCAESERKERSVSVREKEGRKGEEGRYASEGKGRKGKDGMVRKKREGRRGQ